jgi:hypothetical protein
MRAKTAVLCDEVEQDVTKTVHLHKYANTVAKPVLRST